MAQECEGAFPEAVEVILDVLVPYQLYQISHSLTLEGKHHDLVRQYPRAFVTLLSVLIDPAAFPVPNDLAAILEACVAADPNAGSDPAFIRLHALRRLRSA